MMPIAGLILMGVTAPSLSTAQKRALARGFVCPERLPDDAARIEAVKRFINRYAIYAPRSTINERLAFRDSLLARHKCSPAKSDLLHHDFPQL